MQTTKLLFVIGLVGTLAASERTYSAVDTPQQIQARQALRQKMAELDALSATNTAPTATPSLSAPAAPEKPAPSTPPAAPPPVVPPVATTQKKAPVVPVAPVPVAKIPDSSEFGPVPDGIEDANTARARAAMRSEMALLQVTPAVPTKSGHPKISPARIASTPLVMEVPPDPLSAAKAARMAELLQRYKEDQITPQEYHKQRAAILTEP